MKPSITLLTTLLPVPFGACRSAAEEKAIPEVPVAAAAGEKWERQARPILENFNNMDQPCVAEVGGEWRYRMWFFGWVARHDHQGPWNDCIYSMLPKSGTGSRMASINISMTASGQGDALRRTPDRTTKKNETEPTPTQSVYPIVHRAHGAGPVYCCHRLGGGSANPEAGQ
jgi:hypothetical protein